MATQASIPTLPAKSAEKPAKKKLVRRSNRDISQQLRLGFQLTFLAINAWIGTQFYFWVRHYETLGATRLVERPAGVEGWLPIAALMNLKYLIVTGSIPHIHPAGMFLLIAFLGMTLLFRKAFCGWLCPVGTVSEYLWKFGRRTFRRNFSLPRWADIPLRALKYVLLSFFVYLIASMGADALSAFLSSPYGLIADVKMLNFFRYMGTTAAVTVGVLVVLSFFVQNFWCRYLCPYGALMGLVSVFSPVRIQREPEPCIDCAKCAKACPASLPVDKLVQIRSAECIGCLECVAVCPAEGALHASVGIPLMLPQYSRRISPIAIAAGIAILFFGLVGFAKATGNWRTNVPPSVYQQLVPAANETAHPM